VDKLNPTDVFDFIFLTVRYDQIRSALTELKNNNSRKFAENLISSHVMKAKEEMILLNKEFSELLSR
jgi:hypothetical protein